MKTFCLTLLPIMVASFTLAQKTPTTLAGWQEKLRTAEHDTTRLTCYAEISPFHIRADSIKFYAKKGLSIGRQYPEHIANARFYNELGRAFQVEAKLDSGIYFLKKAHELALKFNNDKQIKYADFNLVILSTSPAEQVSRLLKMLKKYSYQPDTKEYDKLLLFGIYRAISSSYLNLNNTQKSRLYLQKSREYASTYADSLMYYSKYSSLLNGEVAELVEVQNYDATKGKLESYRRLLEEAQKVVGKQNNAQSDQCMAVLYGNYSDIMTKLKRYQEAIHYLNLAASHMGSTPEYLTYAKYLSLGNVYVGKRQYSKGIEYLKKANNFFENFDTGQISHYTTLRSLAEAHELTNDYKQAYQYSKQALNIQNKYLNAKQQQLSLEVEKQFELSEKQEEIAAQELENKLKEERIKIEKQQKNIVLSLLTLSLCLLGWAFWGFKKQQKLGALLEQEKQKLEIKTQELSKTNQTKDKIFAVLSHDLKSPISDLKTILMLFYSKDISTSKMKELVQSLTMKIETVQGIMTNLLQWSLLELKHQPFSAKIVLITPVLEKVVAQLQTAAQQKQITIETILSPVQIEANPEDVEIIIRNILYNSIKFTPNGGTIRLRVEEQEKQIAVICTDTGIGINQNILHEIRHHLPTPKVGTAGETGSGLGLRISTELAQRNNGSISIESEINKATEVTIAFANSNL